MMGDNTSIRPLLIADYDAVHALWLRTPGMGLNTRDDSREGIAAFLQRNPSSCFVAQTAARELAGVIITGHDGRRGYIYHACVDTKARHQGIGRRLVQAALEALRAEGISKVALVVFANNPGGNGFWERLGFTLRTDLHYRNKALVHLERIDT